MKPLLTKKKAKWAENRNVVLRGTRLNYSAAIQSRYERDLLKLVRTMTETVTKEIKKLFKSQDAKAYFKNQKKIEAMDASLSSQARIMLNLLMKRFDKLFSLKAKILPEKMIKETLSASKSNLHTSLKQLSGGLSLKTGIISKGTEEASKAIIAENVSLIKSIPQQYFKNITGAVMRSITEGQGIKDLVPQIQKYSTQTKRRVQLLALDQTRKAYSAINKQKMIALGIKKFEWIHSYGGQKPRDSHLKIDGQIFSFENLEKEQAALGVPEKDRGLPGFAINCRCVSRAVIEFD